MSESGARWRDAETAAALIAVDPAGLGGVVVHARHGPVRDAWLAGLGALLPEGTALRRLPPSIADDRLLGGLDLAATLGAGRPVSRTGLLAEADGGLVLLPMAERAEETLVGRLSGALDIGRVRAEREGLSIDLPARIGLVALDESGAEEEGVAEALLDRLAFRLDLDGIAWAETGPPALGPRDIAAARAALPGLADAAAGEDALAAAAAACAIPSLRAPILAMRAARALRALYGAAMSAEEAVEIAARLVIAPRARALPPAPGEEEEEQEPETPPEPPPPEAEDTREDAAATPETEPAPDRVLDAVRAALPADLIAGLADALRPRPVAAAGRSGAARRAPDRGRPIAARPGQPGGRARLDVVETLRAAAPWQSLRRGAAAPPGPARAGREATPAPGTPAAAPGTKPGAHGAMGASGSSGPDIAPSRGAGAADATRATGNPAPQAGPDGQAGRGAATATAGRTAQGQGGRAQAARASDAGRQAGQEADDPADASACAAAPAPAALGGPPDLSGAPASAGAAGPAGAEPGTGRVHIRSEDFRIRRFKRHTGTTTIFVVDASGSSAVSRLAEAKGAVEIMLAEAYVRRDQVALVAFRGRGAEVLLPPTQSPALARRRLAGLPGGGGTPMAAGLETALALAERVRAAGSHPHLVMLTDGGANIARDGAQGRPAARADAEAAARALAAAGIAGIVIDTGPRPRREAEDLAHAMRARYLPLPRADAGTLSRVARVTAGA